MTREEAIKAIKTHCYFANLVPVGKEALDMAIEALKAEPCEDAISRQEFIDALVNATDIAERCGTVDKEESKRCLPEIIRWIKSFPPVTPKQKTGEWIKLKDQKPVANEDVLVKDIDGEVRCAHMSGMYDDIIFYEAFGGECIEDVVEWREIPE